MSETDRAGVSSIRLAGRAMAVAAIAALLPLGCNGGESAPAIANPPAASVSPPSQWNVTGDLRPADAIADGNPATIAVSDQQYRGAQVTIDLGKPCLFNMVVLDHGRRQMGFCRRMSVLTSIDGKDFEHRLSLPGTRQVTTACLLTPVLARYVRLRADVPGDEPWSIATVRIR
ncbi:MAG: discoidin domain-containing protein [Phycisphaerae bacterium]